MRTICGPAQTVCWVLDVDDAELLWLLSLWRGADEICDPSVAVSPHRRRRVVWCVVPKCQGFVGFAARQEGVCATVLCPPHVGTASGAVR